MALTQTDTKSLTNVKYTAYTQTDQIHVYAVYAESLAHAKYKSCVHVLHLKPKHTHVIKRMCALISQTHSHGHVGTCQLPSNPAPCGARRGADPRRLQIALDQRGRESERARERENERERESKIEREGGGMR